VNIKNNKMERAISTIKMFNLNKDQIEQFASQVLDDIYNHDGNVLDTAICLSAMESMIKKVRAGVKDLIIQESDKYGEKTFDYKGARITKTSRVSYDYSNTDQWNVVTEKRKEIEGIAKTIKDPIADTETGEIINPAQKKISESISITIK